MIKLAMFDMDGTLIEHVTRKAPCEVCNGTGLDPRRAKCLRAKPKICERCNGRRFFFEPDGEYGRVTWLPNRKDRLAEVAAAGTDIAICTNQTGVHWGHHTREQVETKLQKLHDDIESLITGTISDVLVLACFEPGPCRKPETGMLDMAMREFGVEPWETLFVGDMDTDEQAAKRAHVAYADAGSFFRESAVQTAVIGGS